MNVADFRHGPMELAAPGLTILMLESASQTAELNRGLAQEVARLGGNPAFTNADHCYDEAKWA